MFWEIAVDPLSINYFYYETVDESKCKNVSECVEVSTYQDLTKDHT